jgi:hypothetical protein
MSAIVGSCLGVAILMGSFFVVTVMARSWWADFDAYAWPEVSATIVESHVFAPARADQDPSLAIRYRYNYAGQTYESDRLDTRESRRDPDAYRLAAAWTVGSTWSCYVDPRNPQVAVLRRESLWWGLAVLLPIVVGSGLGGLLFFAAWRSLRAERAQPTLRPKMAKMLTVRVATTLFVAILASTTYWLGVRPLLLFESATKWGEQRCTIISSRIRAYSSHGRTNYRPDVLFQYEVDGTERTSNQYDLLDSSDRAYRDVAAIVERYSPGVRAQCYVNPSNHSQAVLDRSLPSVTPFGLIALVALIIVGWRLASSVTRRAGSGTGGT